MNLKWKDQLVKVAIVGTRNFKDSYLRVKRCLLKQKRLFGNIVIVTGGGGLIDHSAMTVGIELGLTVIIYPADWDKYGKKAGVIRNKKIVNAADKMFAFWDGKSPGTSNSILLAQQKGIPVIIRREERRGE